MAVACSAVKLFSWFLSEPDPDGVSIFNQSEHDFVEHRSGWIKTRNASFPFEILELEFTGSIFSQKINAVAVGGRHVYDIAHDRAEVFPREAKRKYERIAKP